ncbi:MAG TPA: response regulator transcription factor [Candidatus Limnocylindrales bacterium]|nr:response regulator transcription factor [Candidatus Limnocylindrales bacterium]
MILAGHHAGVPSPGPDVDIVVAADGPAFVGFLHELKACLALLTCPPGGPTEILAAVTDRRQRPALRIILLNDPADVTGRLEALALGFDDALPASIDPEELTGRALLLANGNRGVAGHERQIPVAPGVILDLVGRRVRRGGVDVHLRPKEFALLSVLASDPGRVFSRTELVDRAWGPAYDGGSRTIDVHIRWLRAKIERDPARPSHVVTVRGTGYRLDPFVD